MIACAWLCLVSPLAGAVAITLAGGRISRRTAGWISTLTTFVAFAGALVAFVGLWGEGHGDREHLSTAYTWLESGDFEVELQILLDTLSSTMMLIVSGVGGLIVWYSMGYLAGDDEERRYFAYMSLFVFSMLLLVQAGNFLLLLAGWGLVGLASYLLIGFWHHKPEAVEAAKKAFVMNAIGDATLALGLVLLIWETGTLEYLGVFEEVGSDPAPHVASGRHGGPNTGLRPDPRGHDGDGRRLPPRPREPGVRSRTGRPAPRRDPRGADAACRRSDRGRAVGHQARHRVLDDVADRLHVRRGRNRRVRLRDLPPDDARLLQGAAVHERRRRHPPPRRRAGHPQDGRPADAYAAYAPRVPRGLARPRRHPDLLGVLVEGRSHRGGVRERRRARRVPVRGRADRRAAHRALHVPPLLHRVPWRAERPREGARPRGPRRRPEVDARPGGGAHGPRHDRWPGRDPRRVGAVPALDRRDRRASRARHRDRGLRHERDRGLARAARPLHRATRLR